MPELVPVMPPISVTDVMFSVVSRSFIVRAEILISFLEVMVLTLHLLTPFIILPLLVPEIPPAR